jgi:hypothetical protein
LESTLLSLTLTPPRGGGFISEKYKNGKINRGKCEKKKQERSRKNLSYEDKIMQGGKSKGK